MTHTALLKRFNELAAKATPGPWSGGESWEIISCSGDECPIVAKVLPCGSKEQRLANTKLLAAPHSLLQLASAQARDIEELVACLREVKASLVGEPELWGKVYVLLERIDPC